MNKAPKENSEEEKKFAKIPANIVEEQHGLVENPDMPGSMITQAEYKDIMKGKQKDPDWFRNN